MTTDESLAEPTRAGARPSRRLGWTLRATGELLGRAMAHLEAAATDLARDADAIAASAAELADLTARKADAIGTTVEATPWLARVVGEGLHLAATVRATRSGLFGARVVAPLYAASAERILRLCRELGGGVLKAGQFASTRADLLPPAYIEALSQLQDDCPPLETSLIVARIERELGRPLDSLFASFDERPLGSASLAQVHRAQLPDGCSVAVKVLRPGVEQLIESDVAALRLAIQTAGARWPQLGLAPMLDELASSLARELDFEQEAAAARAFAAHFDGSADVVVPRPIETHSGRCVLTLELIEGRRMLDFCDEAAERDRGKLDALMATLVRATCAQVLEHGLFHADPHPGNFLVVDTDPPKLALLDFGSTKRCPTELRAAYVRLLVAVAGRDRDGVAQQLRAIGFSVQRTAPSDSGADDDDDLLCRCAEVLLESFRPGQRIDAIDPQAVLERTLAVAREAHVSVPAEFVMLGRVLGAVGGLLMRYRPQIELFPILAPFLAPRG